MKTGKILKTLIIFRKLKKAPPGPFPDDVVVLGSDSGVMTGKMMVEDYLPKVNIIINIKY